MAKKHNWNHEPRFGIVSLPENTADLDGDLALLRVGHLSVQGLPSREKKDFGMRKDMFRHLRRADRSELPNVPGGSLRGERANFTRLVLACIEADFCKWCK